MSPVAHTPPLETERHTEMVYHCTCSEQQLHLVGCDCEAGHNAMRISSDSKKNPALAGELSSLRGDMVAAAEKAPLPERYDARPHPDQPAMIILDHDTGRTTVVPIFAYGAVRQALADLQGPLTTERSPHFTDLNDARQWLRDKGLELRGLDGWVGGGRIGLIDHTRTGWVAVASPEGH